MQTKIKIFGDQKLFEKGPDDAEMVAFSGNSLHLMFYKFIDGEVFFCTEGSFKYTLVGSGCPSLKPEAMRMAIPDDLSFVYDLFKIGEKSRSHSILRQNIENAIRRADCLDFIEREYFTEIMDDEEEPCEHCPLSWGDTPEHYSKAFGEALQAKIDAAVIANKLPVSQLEMDGVPSFYIGMHGVCTHRMGLLDIPVWCKDADSVLIAMNFINNYQQPKTEPKCWTIADQQAGRLPPAGSKYLAGTHNIELECLYNDSKGNAWGFDAQGEVYGFAINYCYPIETQAEKAQRLRDEWRIKALSSASILSGMQEYELKRLGGYIGDIYDALLSGELSMPVKGGE